MGDFEKNFLQALCWKKKIACSTNEIEKILALLQARKKKMLQSYFIINIPGVHYDGLKEKQYPGSGLFEQHTAQLGTPSLFICFLCFNGIPVN